MGVFSRQIFTIHSLRCSSFARNRRKDSSPRTALGFLHPILPSTPQRRRLTSCTSSLGKTPHLHNFFHVCAFWHVTRGTWGHRVTKKRRTPKEICWSSSRTSNNNPVLSFFFRSRQESTPQQPLSSISWRHTAYFAYVLFRAIWSTCPQRKHRTRRE